VIGLDMLMIKIKKFMSYPLSKKFRVVNNIYYLIKSQLFYKFFFKSIGKNSIIKNPLLLSPEYISMGKNVYILDDARIEGVEHYHGVDFKPHIIIEDGVIMNQRCHITAADTLIIGENTTISFDVMITNVDHEYEDLSLSIIKQPLVVKKTEIGKNCFLGGGVKIQAGTILGRHCIVGTNAVVRGVFPDYCVIVGIPAKIVKRYNSKTEKWEKTNAKGEFIDEI
jgi:acetyltransferase-like isoleucine patch superfamily enzyme